MFRLRIYSNTLLLAFVLITVTAGSGGAVGAGGAMPANSAPVILQPDGGAAGDLAGEAVRADTAAGQAAAAQKGEIERFDVKKGQVVARVPVTEELRDEIRKLALSAAGSAGTFRIDPADGTVLHVPLQPALEIRQPGFFALAAEAFVFLPDGREPYILFFSEENQPRLFGLGHSVKHLLALCGWADAYEGH